MRFFCTLRWHFDFSFQVSTTGIADILLVFPGQILLLCGLPHQKQNLSMLYAILRNPNFTSALFIPMVLRMRFPARCVMLPNTCSILERVLALVRFPCFSHEVRGCPLYPSMLGFVKLLLQLFPVFLYLKRNSPYLCSHRCRLLPKSKLIVPLFLFLKRHFLALHTGCG